MKKKLVFLLLAFLLMAGSIVANAETLTTEFLGLTYTITVPDSFVCNNGKTHALKEISIEKMGRLTTSEFFLVLDFTCETAVGCDGHDWDWGNVKRVYFPLDTDHTVDYQHQDDLQAKDTSFIVTLSRNQISEHNWSEWKDSADGVNHMRACMFEYCKAKDEDKHTGGEATCMAQAVCEICKMAYGSVDADNHNRVVLPAVPPTYTETGLTEGVKCDDCGEILVPQDVVPMLIHLPQTGDDSDVILWSALACISLFGMTMLVRKRKEA